jgi:hypothetical protein
MLGVEVDRQDSEPEDAGSEHLVLQLHVQAVNDGERQCEGDEIQDDTDRIHGDGILAKVDPVRIRKKGINGVRDGIRAEKQGLVKLAGVRAACVMHHLQCNQPNPTARRSRR